MFMSNQIVWNVDTRTPMTAYSVKARATHFIESTGDGYKVALPESIEDALAKLALNLISPAPLSPTHCPHCYNWWNNHNDDGSCWK